MSYGQSPALVAIATKAAISALQGNVMPQLISIPIPVATYKDLKPGVNYWPDLNANFFAPNQFLPCGVNFTAPRDHGAEREEHPVTSLATFQSRPGIRQAVAA